MKTIALLLMTATCVVAGTSRTSEWRVVPEWEQYFKDARVEGTFLLYDLNAETYLVYNAKRANASFIPASTYKIFNSLVAIETAVVRDENEILKWDGIDRGSEGWNQDQNMKTAFQRSTVWFYQEMARRIGQARMQHYVNLAGYGNQDISGALDHFWLDGALRITPRQQIDLLVRLHRNDLPFSRRTINIVKDIFVNEKTENYTLRAKTGWAQQVGWWVGYVERDNKVYFYALNIDIKTPDDAKARIRIGRSILADMKIIE
jgi:beta-lactamase class D